MSGLDFIILGLATLRITLLFVRENGPWMIFKKLREKAGIVHDDSGGHFQVPLTFRAQLLDCEWCFSIYAAAFWGGLWFIFGEIVIKIALVFSLSAFSIVLIKHLVK